VEATDESLTLVRKLMRSINLLVDLGKKCVHQEVEASTKKFVPHKDGQLNISECKCTCIPLGIFPLVERSKPNADHIEEKDKCEKFPFNYILPRALNSETRNKRTGRCCTTTETESNDVLASLEEVSHSEWQERH